jgi:hypothetical protein
MNVADIRALARLRPFSWSTYQLDRQGDVFVYKQTVGAPSGRPIGDVGWTGNEIVIFRMHIPSEITFHNTPTHRVERGNILEWEQPLSARRQGVPVDLQVTMEPETILYTTLLLFGGTVVAAAFTFGVVLWFVWRRGARETHVNAEG